MDKSRGQRSFFLDVVHWENAQAERVACGLGGSVIGRRILGTPDRIELTFNVQFSDGTTWLNRKFTVDAE